MRKGVVCPIAKTGPRLIYRKFVFDIIELTVSSSEKESLQWQEMESR